MAITEISVSKIYVLATEPTNKVKDRFWFDTTNNELKRYNGTKWVPISVDADSVKAVYPDKSTTTLSDYLSTLTTAVGDLNTGKQDKLKFYTEFDNVPDVAKLSADEISVNANAIIYLNGEVSGKAITTSIPTESEASDNLLLSEKAIVTALSTKQNSTDNNLETSSKTVSGAINELNTMMDSRVNYDAFETYVSNTAALINTKANKDASNLSTDNITSWKEKLDIDVLEADIDTKQNNLLYYRESVSIDQTASIQGAKSFSIENTSNGLIIGGNDGGITIENNNINAGQGVISITNNTWTNDSDPILFDINGDGIIKISDALLIPEIKNKQNSTDTTLNTTDKTIVGAINELLALINTNVITSTEQKRITTTSSTVGIQMSTMVKACMVSINPVKTNVGAIYISTSSDTAPTINPLYPDQMPKYKFPDASQVYIWSDVNGDSVDLTIEYYG